MSSEKESRAIYRKADKENLHLLLHKSFLPNSHKGETWKDGKPTSKGTATALAVSFFTHASHVFFQVRLKLQAFLPSQWPMLNSQQWRFPGQKRMVLQRTISKGWLHNMACGHTWLLLTPPGVDWGDDWTKVSPKPEWRWPGHDEVYPKSLCSPWVDDSYQEDSADRQALPKKLSKQTDSHFPPRSMAIAYSMVSHIVDKNQNQKHQWCKGQVNQEASFTMQTKASLLSSLHSSHPLDTSFDTSSIYSYVHSNT